MLKKSLIALAVSAAALTGAANAASLSATAINVAKEGNTATGSAIIQHTDVADITIDVGVDYIVNDIVEVTLSGATFDTTVTPTLADGTPTNATSTLVFVDFSNANTARFRVTGADVDAADALVLGNFTVKLAGVADATKIKVATQAISVNPLIGAYDKASAITVATVREQTEIAYTKLNGQVSTGNGRAQFVTSPNLDELTVTVTDNASDVDAVTFNKVTHTIKGNFGWLMDYDKTANGGDADGVLEPGELATAIAFSPTAVGAADTVAYAIDTGLTTLTAVQTVNGGIDLVTKFGFKNVGNAAGGSVIAAPQSFTHSAVFTDGTTSVTEAAASAGAFTLDGSSTDIAFMPFGADYSQSITVTNSGSVVGAITVTLHADGMTYSKELTATSTGKSVVDISQEVRDFAAASGVKGNAAINVTTNSPGIEVKGIYYHKPTQDRILVGENTSN
ncbi:hypothetical protein [Thalassotalea marina]|uniref:Uncharacterized protein n=1 Tax=Thalassotalea marina TaxID=1673741 RepID=A0A919BBJ3_9GAMM|nr:hypothetical protein [Thalassotalea marina]GHF80902.1 hypothetical protein GCM10017161_05270 [Thalassotalea marina]